MSTPVVFGIVLVLYLLQCIRQWRKLDKLDRQIAGSPGHTSRNQRPLKSVDPATQIFDPQTHSLPVNRPLTQTSSKRVY